MSTLPGPKILLLGDSGTGKTYSIRTLIKCGITPFCIFTEQGFEVLGDIPKEQLHWHYIRPGDIDWFDMIESAKKINSLSYESLTKLTDINKRKFDQFIDLLSTLNNFKCDRDGREYGDVCSWGTDRAIVLDGMSGMSQMAMDLVVGSKPVKHQGDWGVAMDNLSRLIAKLCVSVRCTMILIGHQEREIDEVAGGSKIMVATLGKKLAPKIPINFSDVIMAKREGTRFTWSTIEPNMVLKARSLPLAENLPPDFEQIFRSWKARGGTIDAAIKEAA